MENNVNEEIQPEIPQTAPQEPQEPVFQPMNNPWMWVRFGLVAFGLMLFYIYNQHHANKGLRKKEQLIKELKELRSEKISLESEVTNAGKQSEVARRLEGTGVKEITKPPYKIEYRKDKK